jgi:hypothetical protein
MKTVFMAALIGAAMLSAQARADAAPAWVEMVAGHAEARVVTDAARCPVISIDGHPRKMTERAPVTADFANRVCEIALPTGVREARIEGVALPLPKARPNRLVILGDSGCRLKGPIVQHCNDPGGWPFARVAALAAARKPDLVIHVGDYYYRETPCPAGEGACAGSPFGDRWPTWKAELYDPAALLLSAAPWVFTRGNHEDCKRGGAGWFRLLDAAATPKSCPAASDTFSVDIGGIRLVIVDSADTEDAAAPPPLVAAFASRLEPVLANRAGPPAWIVTHRPIWNAARNGETLSDGVVNATERAAVKGRDLAGVQMVLSGHVHNFTSLDFGAGRPPQLVVGTGGVLMDPNDLPPPVTGPVALDGLTAQAFTMGRWGYFVFDRGGADWIGTFRDLSDTVAAVCRLHARSLTCTAPVSTNRSPRQP